MTFEELTNLVQEWGDDKGITDPENVEKQFGKFIEEVFEFKTELDFLGYEKELLEIDGVYNIRLWSSKTELYNIRLWNSKTELGDILVTLIILSKQLDIDMVECLEMAYKKIKDRKGKTIDGVFVKEEDLEDEI